MQRHAVLYPDGSMNVLADNPGGLTAEEQARLEACPAHGSVHVLVEVGAVVIAGKPSQISQQDYRLLSTLPDIVATPHQPPKPTTEGSPRRGTKSKRRVRP